MTEGAGPGSWLLAGLPSGGLGAALKIRFPSSEPVPSARGITSKDGRALAAPVMPGLPHKIRKDTGGLLRRGYSAWCPGVRRGPSTVKADGGGSRHKRCLCSAATTWHTAESELVRERLSFTPAPTPPHFFKLGSEPIAPASVARPTCRPRPHTTDSHAGRSPRVVPTAIACFSLCASAAAPQASPRQGLGIF